MKRSATGMPIRPANRLNSTLMVMSRPSAIRSAAVLFGSLGNITLREQLLPRCRRRKRPGASVPFHSHGEESPPDNFHVGNHLRTMMPATIRFESPQNSDEPPSNRALFDELGLRRHPAVVQH